MWRPVIMGPVTSWTAGLPAESAPINCAGTVLSQPPIITTESIGCARIISSTSIDMRLRNIMLVGLRNTSPERNRREGSRQASGGEYTPGHRFRELRHGPVTIVEAAWRNGDPYHRLRQQLRRKSHGARHRSTQVARKIAVAVIGGATIKTWRFGHSADSGSVGRLGRGRAPPSRARSSASASGLPSPAGGAGSA